MESNETLHDLDAAVRLRSAAYGEHAAARAALEEAESKLRASVRAVQFDSGFDPVLSATLSGREAIARIGLEEARERLREANRDLRRARQLSAPLTAKEYEIESLD
ncbi:hypothetical protein [Rhizobium leguminosarum]|uniref:Uncharacterized protein n=1 Tax=Rhizobium leguminosarum bv. viciae TaxID=387 RepID=A0A8G2MVE5_RHILV|nr:hypothetical protein [Rhizobium leguminosarum]MBY5619967.1 hypothetical protein [Rhizobium leguminosarum]NKK18619.1 hypothetical protein [Rhizobium leguminosarum bv. viciae]TBX98094.1 hypothetical protein E0H31_04085 [Rhizobium leguminosarum bv. viciae]TBZ09440.1 hypothetical protein E0H33_25460 [Rhizobium leguminosarum bv. viciae]TBZ10930.1 hypothetical protein E0H52_32530 [Rhizobium leguminosarum bv. viciae]